MTSLRTQHPTITHEPAPAPAARPPTHPPYTARLHTHTLPAPMRFVFLAFLAAIALAWAQEESNYVIAATSYAEQNCRSEKCGTVPDCQCAEFAARAIAAGGCLPGLTSVSPKLAYARFMPGGGTWKGYTTPGAYNLAWVRLLRSCAPHAA